MRRVLVVLGCACVLAAPSSATTLPSLTVGVNVSLKEKGISLSQNSVHRGYYVQFRVRNTTPLKRTFSVAGRSIVVPAKKLRLMAVEFDVRGTYPYVSRGRTAARGIFRVS
jgi:hypothetical protein